MKIFKAIIYAILLIIWLLFTIVAICSVLLIGIIVGFFPDEWFGIGEDLFEELKNL